MIYIPWQASVLASACCDKFDIKRHEIADHGFVAVWGNRLIVHLMRRDDPDPGVIHTTIAYDLDALVYRCDRTVTHIGTYIGGAKRDLGAKLWIGEWVPITEDTIYKTSNSACAIAGSMIGYITGRLSMDACLACIEEGEKLPPVTYRWVDNRLLLRCFGKIITLEDWLSFL